MTTDYQKFHRATQKSADIVDALVRHEGRDAWTEADRQRAEVIRLELLCIHPHPILPGDQCRSVACSAELGA